MRWLVRSVFRDLYPPTEDLPGIDDTDVDAFLKQFSREAPLPMRFGLVLGSVVYVIAPLTTVGLPLPSFLLPKVLRVLHAERMPYTPLYLVRQLLLVVKLVAGFCWGKDPKVRAAMNMEPYPADPGTRRTA